MKIFKWLFIMITLLSSASPSIAWFDETHLAIARAAGYHKWYNAAAADVARVKLGRREGNNHYHNGSRSEIITPEMVLRQAEKYDRYDPDGHLYGAVIGAFRAYRQAKARDGYAGNHMAFLIHYVGDLSMPLHHTVRNAFNKKHHLANDGIINDEVMEKIDKIKTYRIRIASEEELVAEVARIANLSKTLGYQLEDENRLMTREEAYRQVGHSVSLLRAILAYFRSE